MNELLPEIDINEINLYKEMNNNIVSLLKIRNNDICSMYAAKLAAKLIESLQREIAELKSKGKFEDEKNILESIRKRLDEAISEAEDTQHSAAGNDDYKLALLHQVFAGKLREIKGNKLDER